MDLGGLGGDAAQVRPDPRQELNEPERLEQVVIGPGVQCDDHVGFPVAGREHDDHGLGQAQAQQPAQPDPVAVGQAQVQQHQVRLRGQVVEGRPRLGDGCLPVGLMSG